MYLISLKVDFLEEVVFSYIHKNRNNNFIILNLIFGKTFLFMNYK